MKLPSISHGPWSVRVEEAAGLKSVAVINRNGGVVCLVKAGSGRKDANAKAIAAVPLMLEALTQWTRPDCYCTKCTKSRDALLAAGSEL